VTIADAQWPHSRRSRDDRRPASRHPGARRSGPAPSNPLRRRMARQGNWRERSSVGSGRSPSIRRTPACTTTSRSPGSSWASTGRPMQRYRPPGEIPSVPREVRENYELFQKFYEAAPGRDRARSAAAASRRRGIRCGNRTRASFPPFGLRPPSAGARLHRGPRRRGALRGARSGREGDDRAAGPRADQHERLQDRTRDEGRRPIIPGMDVTGEFVRWVRRESAQSSSLKVLDVEPPALPEQPIEDLRPELRLLEEARERSGADLIVSGFVSFTTSDRSGSCRRISSVRDGQKVRMTRFAGARGVLLAGQHMVLSGAQRRDALRGHLQGPSGARREGERSPADFLRPGREDGARPLRGDRPAETEGISHDLRPIGRAPGAGPRRKGRDGDDATDLGSASRGGLLAA